MSFIGKFYQILGGLLYTAVAITSIVLFGVFISTYNKMGADYLLSMKFKSVELCNAALQHLKFTDDQVKVIDAFIKKDGTFQLKDVNLTTAQLETVTKTAEDIKGVAKTVSIVSGCIMGLCILIALIAIIGHCTRNNSMKFENCKEIFPQKSIPLEA